MNILRNLLCLSRYQMLQLLSNSNHRIIYSFQNVEMEIRDEENLRFVFDTDVNNLINILETRGITK